VPTIILIFIIAVDGQTLSPTQDLNGRATVALPGACSGRTILLGEAVTVRQYSLNNAQTCEFLIHPVAPVTSILFKFKAFQLESNADYLYVYQGSGPSKLLLCAPAPVLLGCVRAGHAIDFAAKP
jgi:hypothetical protein